MNIVYCFNDNRVEEFLSSVSSLLQYNKCKVFCLVYDFSRLFDLVDFQRSHGFSFDVIDITLPLKKNALASVYARFLAYKFIDDNFVYLDTDTIIKGSLFSVWSDFLLSDKSFGVAPDCVPYRHKIYLFGSPDSVYYNLGVWFVRKSRYNVWAKSFISVSKTYDFRLKDQDVFNFLVDSSDVYLLPSCYNYLSQFRMYSLSFLSKIAFQQYNIGALPVIIHYNGRSSKSLIHRFQRFFYNVLPRKIFEFVSFVAFYLYFTCVYFKIGSKK